jgi:dynein heavy chain
MTKDHSLSYSALRKGLPPLQPGAKATPQAVAQAQVKIGAPAPAVPGDGAAQRFPTFIESLNLDPDYETEFQSGNFLYLRPKSDLMNCTAYDLEIVEHYETMPDNYYTMSASGITHFLKGDPDFTFIEDWEREYRLFNMIRQIPFFSKYRIWKSFVEWKKTVRFDKLNLSKEGLQKDLFLFTPALRDALLKLLQLCYDVQDLRLVSVDRERTYTLTDFVHEQQASQDNMAMALKEFSESVRSLAKLACDDMIDKFLQENNIVADVKMTFMERAALRTECRKLTKFLRLADFLVVDTLRALALESYDELLGFFTLDTEGPPGRIIRVTEETAAELPVPDRPPIFTVEASFNDDGDTCITPSHEEFAVEIQQIIADSIVVIGGPERVLGHPELAAYTDVDGSDDVDDNAEDDTSLEQVVMADDHFKETSKAIHEGLETALDEIMDYTQVFAPFKDIFFENSAYIEEIEEIYKDVDLHAYSAAITKYKNQSAEFTEIPYQADVGIVRADSMELKKRLMPSPVLCLNALKELLPKLMNRDNKKLMKIFADVLPIVTSTPSDVEAFALKCTTCEKGAEDLPAIRAAYDKVGHMEELMAEHEWSVPDDEKAHKRMITDDLALLESAIEMAAGSLEEDTKKFAKDVLDQIDVLNKSVLECRSQLDNALIAQADAPIEKVLQFIAVQDKELTAHKLHSDQYSYFQGVLKQPVTEYETLGEVLQDMNLKKRLWEGVRDWGAMTKNWIDTPFAEIDAGALEKEVQTYTKLGFSASKGLPGNPVGGNLSDSVAEYKPLIPVITDLRNKALKDRHWNEIHDLIGFQIRGDTGFTLGKLIEMHVAQHSEEIQTISVSAQQEQVLEEMLAKVSGMWTELDVELMPYKEQKDMYTLGSVEDITVGLDDSLVTINTILGSRFVGAIRDEVERWRHKLVIFQETLDEWLAVQRNWMYLETIFSAPDIQRQLPEASKRFFAVDKAFRDCMFQTNENPNALRACTRPGLTDTFKNQNAILDKIQKNLEDYLETKRMAFPRFYFLSNDELLEILAQTKNVQAVQPHLRKCFDNLVALDFGEDPKSIDIYAMFSAEDERVPLGKNLKARGNVEDWLTAVEKNMQESLHKLLKAALLDFDEKERPDWTFLHPGQCVATVAQMTWARDTETCLNSDDPVSSMAVWYQKNLDDLQDLIKLIRSDLKKINRKIICALVTTDVHARDIVEELYQEKIDTTNNFEWQKCLRYYWDEEVNDCIISHSDARICYGYEYMGACMRLVITPMTDRCWMTITGSYGLKLGAAPAGPAGTGKTESSKDLAKAMAILCVVFNCSDQIDYKFMGKLFRGLAQMGGWVCLDEFNRIDIEVLSVIAQQMLVLREGRVAGKDHINFMGVHIKLQDHHVIITMNPGYAGRTELPDNLAACFRPVSMMVPDYGLIAEIMLFAEGFGDAKTLSRKMCKLYILCSEQLSQQPHYDYGLRAVKSVLVMAGGLKRGNPDLSEDVVLIRALRDSNQPKFLSFDIPLFKAIVQDLFPGVSIPDHDYGEFGVALNQELAKAGLQQVDAWITKVRELFDIMQIRFGVCLVGPAGGGKTANWKILQKIMTTLREEGVDGAPSSNEAFQAVHAEILNPKCITMGELYGEFNEMTQEWHDGLAPTIMRRAVAKTDMDKKWTVWDGPIDALWIENMNTVLDDNMTLCLANGERIKLKVEMKMLFEVMDLAVASPATVSRIGIVYVTPEDLGWFPYVQSWVAREMTHVPEATQAHILGLYEKFFDAPLKFCYKRLAEPITTYPVQQSTNHCVLFQALFQATSPVHGQKGVDFAGLDELALNELATKVWVFSLVWSVGVTNLNGWEQFNDYLREYLSDEGLNFGMPGLGQVYDYFVDFETNEFKRFEAIIPTFSFDKELPYFQILVETIDTVRFGYCFETLLYMKKPFFVTGVTGTGKTALIQAVLNRLAPSVDEGGQGVMQIPIGFSAQTDSNVTQITIEGKLEKKRKTLLGAPANKKVVLFVDDVNMPFVQEYGAQAPIELLRQFVDQGGFYDRDKLFWKDIQDTVLITASAPPGGGRNEVTPRFVRHFNVLCMQAATDNVLDLIFTSILGGFLDVCKFQDTIKGLTKGTAKATIEIYNRISAELLPTPSKSHYTFNLRDISKVFQGLLMIRPSKCQDNATFQKLWIHESQRVFYDRLTDTQDQLWFEEVTCELLGRFLSCNMSYDDLFANKEQPLMFGDFLKPGLEMADKFYEECKDITKVRALMVDYLDEYNMANAGQMNLVFFTDALKHLARIGRVLRQPRGNLMLVGVGGSGKQSLTRLGCSMNEMACKMIALVRGYGINELREDIKLYMIEAGVAGKHTVWMFTDSQIVSDSFLEDINNILNSGEVPNLFPQEEIDKIANDMIPVLKAMGIPETRDNCLAQFTLRVRDYLHIVLCMSPVGDALRINCRQFPSLINCTTIDWFMAWPQAALIMVAEAKLEPNKFDCGTEEIRTSVIEMCSLVHVSAADMADKMFETMRRKTYTTPKSYLDLIAVYLKMLKQKRDAVEINVTRMSTGCVKLDETNDIVDSLQADLEKLKPILKVKAAEAEVMLKQVAIDQKDAAVVKTRVEKDAQEVGVQAHEVSIVQADAQAGLDVAMPALNSAVKALDALSKADITEVKSFAKPPPAVMTVMEAVCILLGSKPTWDDSKKLLGDSTFMEQLKGYDKDNIPAAYLKKIAKYVADPDFAVEMVGKVSKAAKSLCMWVHAMDVYSRVAKDVAPKKKKLAEMNAMLAAANTKLAGKEAELKAVLDKVAFLQKQCDDTVAEKEDLAQQAELTKNRLIRADKLTSGLSSEGVRWKEILEELNAQMVDLIGDTFLCAACISYYGAFTGVLRGELVELWTDNVRQKSIPASIKCSLFDVMAEPVVVRDWQLKGLPTDAGSTDSAILVTMGARWPLMIDPQGQANKWIKNMEEERIEVSTMTDANLLRALENCIRVGKPLLIEDLREHIEPALEPVLQKAIFKQGGRLLIHLGDSDIDYDPGFKLFMTSKLPNPHYLPEVCIKVTIINFTVTMDGLEDQLLASVVKAERPDVEEKNVKLMLSMAADKKKLQEIQDNILKMLSESEGNILDDAVLINTLADSKVTGEIITERVAESAKTSVEIEVTRESYRDVATRASLLYFVIADMGNIDPMYQYSLEYFAALFVTCLHDAPAADNHEARLESLIKYTTEVCYVNICRGLFEKDKLLYASLLCGSILRHEGKLTQIRWDMLLKGPGLVEREGQLENPQLSSGAISEFLWDALDAMEKRICDPVKDAEVPEGGEPPMNYPFAGLLQSFHDEWPVWEALVDSANPIKAPLPEKFQNVSLFDKMLLLKCLREDKVMLAMSGYVGAEMGDLFATSPPCSMQDVYDDLDNQTPCVFILSKGSDPTDMLLRFAKEFGFGERLGFVSLGQGQGPIAAGMIRDGCKSGNWVLLQNCMLAKSWMPELEHICFDLIKHAEENNESFRLFLTSSPVTYFPVTILQNGVKMTNEPPRGLRAGMLKDFVTFAKEDEWETCAKSDEWKKLCFSITIFGAMVQERRKFGPLGWNIPYGFNETDLETSIAVLRRFLTEQPVVPWDALLYVTGQINYGGRVTDDWDRRCLMSCLAICCRPDVLDDSYNLSPSGVYKCPTAGASYQQTMDHIKALPVVDEPEIFGMHENANTIYYRDCSRVLLADMLSLQPRSSGGGGGMTPDEIVNGAAEGIEEQVPKALDEDDAGKETFVIQPNGLLNSLAIVLSQEMVKFNRLLNAMRSTLTDVKRAIQGLIVMDSNLDQMYTCFTQNQVPNLWIKVSFATMKSLGSWVKDLVFRVHFMHDWLIGGEPAFFPLQAFFFPQGFMTGTLQTFARKYMVAVNTLSFTFEVLHEKKEDITERPDDGVICWGFNFEGARFDEESFLMAESRRGEIYTDLPLVHMVPKANYKNDPACYMCPVYKTAARRGVLSTTGMSTNFVVALELPTDVDPDRWVLNGAACLLNLTD